MKSPYASRPLISSVALRARDTQPAPRPVRAKERGASLIEIMIVLVILLTGIFLVIRIFPIGFGTLRAHENRTNAVRLSEQLLGQVRADAANLPQGVLMGYIDPNTGAFTYVTGHYPDSLDEYCGPESTTNAGVEKEGPCAASVPYFTNVNNFRLIRGEAVKIPLPTTATDAGGNAVTGSVYTLRFGPVYIDKTVGNPANAPDASSAAFYDSFLAVKSAPLSRVVVESGEGKNLNAAGYLRTQQSYLIDYGDDSTTAFIMFAPRAPASPARAVPFRTFTISYTYEASDGLKSVQQTITVNDSNDAVWQTIPIDASTSAMDVSPGSDVVTRQFARLPAATDWDKYDPYQYKLVSSNVSDYANIGVLNFNPAGANYSEPTSFGNRAFTAYVDYAVLDWHIIHEDREVPGSFLSGNGLLPIRTTLTFIKKYGDVDSDNNTYNGLYNQTGQPNSDLQVFNLDDPSGRELTRGDYNNQAATPNADYFIDDDTRGGSYRTGTIYVNSNRLRAGSKLRILYKAEGDWAVALQKSYDRYTLSRDNSGNPQQYITIGNYNGFGIFPNGKPVGAQIRVPYSDLNKSFLVTLQYRATDGSFKRLSPIQMVADGDSSLNPTIESSDTGSFDQHFAYIDVLKYLPAVELQTGQNRFADATQWYPYGSIQGVSAKARVIWHDNNNTVNTWRVQDLDTFLTPAAQEDVK